MLTETREQDHCSIHKLVRITLLMDMVRHQSWPLVACRFVNSEEQCSLCPCLKSSARSWASWTSWAFSSSWRREKTTDGTWPQHEARATNLTTSGCTKKSVSAWSKSYSKMVVSDQQLRDAISGSTGANFVGSRTGTHQVTMIGSWASILERAI